MLRGNFEIKDNRYNKTESEVVKTENTYKLSKMIFSGTSGFFWGIEVTKSIKSRASALISDTMFHSIAISIKFPCTHPEKNYSAATCIFSLK